MSSVTDMQASGNRQPPSTAPESQVLLQWAFSLPLLRIRMTEAISDGSFLESLLFSAATAMMAQR